MFAPSRLNELTTVIARRQGGLPNSTGRGSAGGCPYFPLIFPWFLAGRTVSPIRMQWPSRFPLALRQSSHDHPLHSSGQHFSYGFSLEFTRTSRQTLPRASVAVVPIVAASIKMLGTML